MIRHIHFTLVAALVLAGAIHQPLLGRGFGGHFGGGGFRGGFGGGLRGGGYRGGFGGGYGGRIGGLRGFGGGAALRNFRSEGLGQRGLGGGLRAGQFSGLGQRLGGLEGGFRNIGAGGRPTRSQLGNFLGLPSDGGLHHLSGETQSRGSQIFDQLRAGDGPGHNFISGQTQSPGSRLYDDIRAGNQPFRNNISGQTQSRGSQIYDRIRSGDQPFRNFIPGQTQSRGSQIYDRIRAGNGPFRNFIPGETQNLGSRVYDYLRQGNHPLRPISPWRIHNHAGIIRRNFHNYYYFTPAWYRRYPAAWYPAVWAYGSPWIYAPWSTLSVWLSYAGQPIYYDYGDNVVYQNNSVYVNGEDAGTPAQYYQQAQDLAETDADQQFPKQEQWMPLGVFALSQADQSSANMIIQLAVNKQGIIRGNYTNKTTGDVKVVHGSVDKKNQRACWTLGDNKNTVFDTGIYNLTKDETSVLVHYGDDRTEQWLMVRLNQKDQPQEASKE